MAEVLKIKKCIDLHLAGGIEKGKLPINASIGKVAMTPDDFTGMTPKLDVKPGDTVKAGDPLWHDKNDVDICVVSPVAGTVSEVVRGEKRKLLRVVVESDNSRKNDYATLPSNSSDSNNQEIFTLIKRSGLWAMMRQLPYDIVPVDNGLPTNIFISAWDSAPLAAGWDVYLNESNIEWLNRGFKVLTQLATNKVYIGHGKNQVLPKYYGQLVKIEGAYPASLPSVLAANTDPVRKGETVWLLSAETVVRLGQAFSGKPVDWTFPVAVAGSEVQNPSLVKAPVGASVAELLAVTGLKESGVHRRIISGNVFVGEKVEPDGYLRGSYRQLTVIPEGDDRTEFMGWASLSPSKMSRNRTFPSFFFRRRKFNPDARLNGGRRAMILSGEYDRYIPMDIMAEYLIKAILARDIERMEALGIYEVTPADFSAAEYADTSKLELQKIVREGLDYMIKEIGTAN